jgi:hypothetical protein
LKSVLKLQISLFIPSSRHLEVLSTTNKRASPRKKTRTNRSNHSREEGGGEVGEWRDEANLKQAAAAKPEQEMWSESPQQHQHKNTQQR